ncbi:MAG: TOBE domain-containing protein [Pseudomonadota bacterium]
MKKDKSDPQHQASSTGLLSGLNPSAIFSSPGQTLDVLQLSELEKKFRLWTEQSARKDVRVSRRRILGLFLIIRYTGARLGEVLSLNDETDIDLEGRVIRLGKDSGGETRIRRVTMPQRLCQDLEALMGDREILGFKGSLFHMDPGYVRRKFYERARDCGFQTDLANPNAIRKSRALELLQSNMPLPLVQAIMGHSTAGLTAACLDFSTEDMDRVVKHFMDVEASKKTSARNTFFSRVKQVKKGDIQSEVEVITLGGYTLFSVITNGSLERLQLRENMFVTAEIKAPWVILAKASQKPMTSARNSLNGTVAQIIQGRITTEIVVILDDGTQVCSIVTEASRQLLDLKVNETIWVLFDAFAVILNVG